MSVNEQWYGGKDAWRRLAVLLAIALLPTRVLAVEPALQVMAPYVEIHTGPGRGYPVVQIAERGETLTAVLRKTDWFRVRTKRGTTGWVSRADMQNALPVDGPLAGGRRNNRRFLLGFSGGRFESEPVASILLGYRPLRWLSLELVFADMAGRYSNSRIFNARIAVAPYRRWRMEPYALTGAGLFYNQPRATLVEAVEAQTSITGFGAGMRIALHRRLYAAMEWSRQTTSFDDFSGWNVGLLGSF